MKNSPLPVLALTCLVVPALAQTPKEEPPPSPLPVRAVTLFSSGVSYTLREGEVNGDATVPLLFRTAQVNDILKSLVLLDAKGTVQPAIYGARDPIGRTLGSFAVDVTEPTSRAELLNRLRGVPVTVQAEGRTIEGRIVGVESKEQTTGETTTTVEVLTVLGEGGLRSVPLDRVESIRIRDERINREFNDALSLLASGSDDKRRTVTLRFEGEGRRTVRVGYVTEAPLWKISYRLVMEGDAAKPYLQGWALVENTSDDDWKDVRLSLVSGRPVSFIQDLYQPLYLPRPVVPPDVIASPYPQLAEGAVEEAKEVKAIAGKPADTAASAPRPAPAAAPSLRAGLPSGGGAGGRGLLAPEAESRAAFGAILRDSGVAAQAEGERAGEQFAYNIRTPVTLPRQQAAMIPVVAQEIGGDKVSLFNVDSGTGRFPLNAVRLKNDTGLHLKGGPVTLFDGGTYAGDARMEDVPPGDSRLITYAVDLAVEGERQGSGARVTERTLSVREGVLRETLRVRHETTYTFRNKDEKPRTLLVEHPFAANQKLVQPEKAAERTRDRYRFELALAPGKSEKLTVVTEEPTQEVVALLNADVSQILAYAGRSEGISPELRAALREIATRRQRISDLQSQAAQKEAEVKTIEADQDRIRKNMTALDKASALYKRYVAELDQQETRIQALRAEANRLRGQSAAAERDLRAFVNGLNIGP